MSDAVNQEWWREFFDRDYAALWSGFLTGEASAEQADVLWNLLRLSPRSRVLDAPCGYGRLARILAERGAQVLGVDLSAALLEKAESERGALSPERLRYLRHDLREPLPEGEFDVALNIFSSLGYGKEADDRAVLATLRKALRSGGLLFIETMHRDMVVANLARGARMPLRSPDGTLMIEEPVFDPLAGRIETTWYWSGPSGQGRKSASLRIYTATELIRMVEDAGFRFKAAHAGCSPHPFVGEGPEMGGRLGLLAGRRTDEGRGMEEDG